MTAERGRLSRFVPWAVLVPAALAVSVLITSRGGNADDSGAPAPMIEPLAVEAVSSYHFDDLGELAAASDLVIVGTVVATERGRLVGDPGGGGVVSRFVTVQVDDLVADRGGLGPSNVVVEEGWLPDGTPVVVNGLAPSVVGDRGIWFLHQIQPDERPAYVVINEQGRFLDVVGRAVGADRDDELVAAVAGRPFDDVVAEVRAGGQR